MSTRREAFFAEVYKQASAVRLYASGPFRPPQVLVVLRVQADAVRCPVNDMRRTSSVAVHRFFLRGDRFLSFLVRTKKATNEDLRAFFPQAGPTFDVLNGRISRLIPQECHIVAGDREYEKNEGKFFLQEGTWPCFDINRLKFAEFVRRFVGKRTHLLECPSRGLRRLRQAAATLTVDADGTIVDQETPTIRFGIDHVDRTKVNEGFSHTDLGFDEEA